MPSTQLRRAASYLKETAAKNEVGMRTLQKVAEEVQVISPLYMHIELGFFFCFI